MLSLDACRQILGARAPATDEQVEELRDRMTKLAHLLIEMAREKRQGKQAELEAANQL